MAILAPPLGQADDAVESVSVPAISEKPPATDQGLQLTRFRAATTTTGTTRAERLRNCKTEFDRVGLFLSSFLRHRHRCTAI